MVRRSSLFAFAAGALVTATLVSTGTSAFRGVEAGDGTTQPVPLDPMTPTSPGRSINPDGGTITRGTPSSTHTASEGSNSRAIAIATQAAGENVIFYFDTELERMLVYQYIPGDRGGLKLRAARHIDYDLKLEDYRGLGDSRDDIKAAYDAAFARPTAGAGGGKSDMPVKKVDLSPGK